MIFHFSVSEQKLLLGLDKSLKTIVGTFLQEIVVDDTLTVPGRLLGSERSSGHLAIVFYHIYGFLTFLAPSERFKAGETAGNIFSWPEP